MCKTVVVAIVLQDTPRKFSIWDAPYSKNIWTFFGIFCWLIGHSARWVEKSRIRGVRICEFYWNTSTVVPIIFWNRGYSFSGSVGHNESFFLYFQTGQNLYNGGVS